MNNSVRKKYWICFLVIGVILIADQALKIWIKTHMAIGDEIPLIGDWCKLHFVENEGMAFGFSFGGAAGKLILSLVRLVASAIIMYYLIRQIRKDTRTLFLVSLSMIFVGAVGNLIDCCFYGLCFSESSFGQVATLFPDGAGYGRFLFGKVVDMFYFPLCEWTWPDWVPLVGGHHAEFFNAIFNVADASICVGVFLLIIDQCFFAKTEATENDGNSIQNSEQKEPQTAADPLSADGEEEKKESAN